MKPIFKNDVNDCVFLGVDTDQKLKNVDMYFILEQNEPSIVMRYGDNENDFISTTISNINESLEDYQNTPFIRNMLIAEDNNLWRR